MKPQRESVRGRVHRLKGGDQSALEELVGAYGSAVLSYCRRVLGRADTADDVAQEVWLKVYRGIHGLEDGDRFGSWLFTITRRCCQDALRAAGREEACLSRGDGPEEESSEHSPSHDRSPLDTAILRDELPRLTGVFWETVRGLSPEARLLYLGRVVARESFEALALRLGITGKAPIEAVQMRLARVREKIASRLRAEGFERADEIVSLLEAVPVEALEDTVEGH